MTDPLQIVLYNMRLRWIKFCYRGFTSLRKEGMQYYPKVLAILGLCHPFDNTSVPMERDLEVFQIANDWLVLVGFGKAFCICIYAYISYMCKPNCGLFGYQWYTI